MIGWLAGVQRRCYIAKRISVALLPYPGYRDLHSPSTAILEFKLFSKLLIKVAISKQRRLVSPSSLIQAWI